MEVIRSLFLFSLLSGFGFESSHSLTSLDETFVTLESCINTTKKLNALSFNEKQVGLEKNIYLRYICIAKVVQGEVI